ncbi:MATE family efflux transporter DinF [Ferrimonas balearica]|uniref:MATE family efflux transporter DinF n=1 Tax=Ferrimonas balearica TaxID=44012 RepID=UPI001C992272|nr:MATE family efflux transporter DinF [Ferrimonas balearica]MBY5994030.1 MATE family efflux transporter DinF [Ferrimonas balearica]
MTITAILRQRAGHKRTFALAMPMILSNVTIPLLGLVDTAVIGHLSDAYFLGGVAVGAMIITFLFWMLGFLRMATTGLVAQGYGAGDALGQLRVLYQAAVMALILAAGLLLLQGPLLQLALALVGGSDAVQHYAALYFSIRIWSAPAALLNLAMLGYLLGRQSPRSAMWLLIVTNSINILLDLYFVVGLEWGVAGAAWASVLADYGALALALVLVWQQLTPELRRRETLAQLTLAGSGRLLALNRDIFIRTLCLQLCMAFVTAQGARLGDAVVAANSVLMNFTLLMAYALDGFAYSAEAEVGRASGARERAGIKSAVVLGGFWSALTALAFTLVFAVGGEGLIALLTDIDAVRDTAQTYLPWVVIYPLLAFTCFLLDGVYIGAAKGAAMRNTMLISALGFFALWWLASPWMGGNHALWLAFCGFIALRSLTLSGHFVWSWRRGHWAG